MKYLVTGAGRMAYGVIHDLLNQRDSELIHITDISNDALQKMKMHFGDVRLHFHHMDAHDPRHIELIREADGMLSAVPYDNNLELTRKAIKYKTHFVDLGGNDTVVRKQFELHDMARQAGIGIIPDCGLAPGMVSVIAVWAMRNFDQIEKVKIRVGGLPQHPKTPLKYQLVFSVHGLINEYIEPVSLLENGEIKKVEPMTGIERLGFAEPFGQMEAFYTSGGVSTLPHTFQGRVQNLDYKTIRYPGHCQLMKAMIDLGFTSEEPFNFNGQKTSSRNIFESMLSRSLSYEGHDVVLIRITVNGIMNNKKLTNVLDAIEYHDEEHDLTAMMRTTAFPAAIILQMLCRGQIEDSGVLKQETNVPPEQFIRELEKRNINFKEIRQ